MGDNNKDDDDDDYSYYHDYEKLESSNSIS